MIGLVRNFVAAAALLTVHASVAGATTFNWSYTGGGANNGVGTLEATETAPNSGIFTIQTISGTANGETINASAPVPAYAGTGSTVYWSPTAPIVFNPLNPFFFTDFLGFAFLTEANHYFALYENTNYGGGAPNDAYACGTDTSPYCLIGPGLALGDGLGDPRVGLTNFALTQTPIPAALPLFATGLGMIGFLAHRRKRKAVIRAD